MNRWWEKIIIWETHCDTVWDFFKNSFILRILRKWYREKYGESLKVWQKLTLWSEDKTDFSDKLYDFVLNIFRDGNDYEEFMSYLKCEYYDNFNKRSNIANEYDAWQITTAIFAMREVMQQLWYYNAGWLNVSTETVKQIFQTKIVSVIEKAFEHTPWDEHPYNSFASVSSIIERWYSPIGRSWELLSFRWDTDDWILVSSMTSNDVFEIQRLDSDSDDMIVNRAELIKRTKMIQRIQESLETGSKVVLTKAEENFFMDLSYDFQQEWWTWDIREYLEMVKQKLYQSVPKLGIEDATMQKPLQDAWLVWEDGKPIFRDVDEIEEWQAKVPPKATSSKLVVVSSN